MSCRGLAYVPKEIAEFCQSIAPQYLYLNDEDDWESTGDPMPIG